MRCFWVSEPVQAAEQSDSFRESAVLARDMTGLHEVDCRISISGSQLVSGGETRERGGEGRPGRRRGIVVIVWVWVVAAMTTDGGGSKQMSTSWQTGPEWSSTERQVDIQEHSGTAETL